MIVGIDITRRDGVAFRIDHLGPVGNQLLNLAIRAYSEDTLTLDRDGLGNCYCLNIIRIGGDDLAIDDDCSGIG